MRRGMRRGQSVTENVDPALAGFLHSCVKTPFSEWYEGDRLFLADWLDDRGDVAAAEKVRKEEPWVVGPGVIVPSGTEYERLRLAGPSEGHQLWLDGVLASLGRAQPEPEKWEWVPLARLTLASGMNQWEGQFHHRWQANALRLRYPHWAGKGWLDAPPENPRFDATLFSYGEPSHTLALRLDCSKARLNCRLRVLGLFPSLPLADYLYQEALRNFYRHDTGFSRVSVMTAAVGVRKGDFVVVGKDRKAHKAKAGDDPVAVVLSEASQGAVQVQLLA